MQNKIFVIAVFLLVITVVSARDCYKCALCPKPFSGNEAGVTKITVGDNDFCQKVIDPILKTENRDGGGSDCTPVDQVKFCCKGNLCNGAITSTFNIKLLATTTGLFMLIRAFY